ncbi:MAG: restriction endonuclease subunit S [Acidimicrobiia bacterium]
MTSVLSDLGDTLPFGRVVKRRRVTNQPDLEPLSVFLDVGVVPRASRDDNHNRLGSDLSKYLVVEPGDIVFNKLRTWQGGFGFSKYHGIVSPAYFVCQCASSFEPRYLHYLFRSTPYLAELTRISKFMPPSQFDISWEDLKQVPIQQKPLAEQRLVADYLDVETGRIDKLISTKQQLIELLEERQQVLITGTVLGETNYRGSATRNLNMNFSTRGGCAFDRGWWRGQPPNGWATARLKDLVKLTNGWAFDSGRFGDTGVPLIRIRDLGKADTETKYDGPVPQEVLVERGDLLVGMDGDFNSAVWKGPPAALNQRLCRLRAVGELDQRYLMYMIDLPLRHINLLTYATTVKHLSSVDLLDQRVPLPPRHEQQAIVDFLDTETARISEIVQKMRRQIGLLREHRQALITAAVTGELEIT